MDSACPVRSSFISLITKRKKVRNGGVGHTSVGHQGGGSQKHRGLVLENSLLRVWSVWSMRMRVPLCPCACRGQRQTLLGVLLHASPYSCKTGFLTKSGARLGSASPMILLSLPSMWRVTGMCVTNHAQLGTWLLEIELKSFCV